MTVYMCGHVYKCVYMCGHVCVHDVCVVQHMYLCIFASWSSILAAAE